jgi:hypothetical protein
LDENVVPQKDDSAGRIVEKAVLSWAAAPMALLDLLADEPRSEHGDSSRDSRSDRGGSAGHRSGGGGGGSRGCTCNCECTCS